MLKPLAVAALLLLVIPVWAWASSVGTSVVDTTAPTGSVTLAPGGSDNITINLSVTGQQATTATFKVYRDWTLSGGTWTGTNPAQFTVPPRSASDPATNFSTTGSVTITAGQAVGTFTLAVGAFDITNTGGGASLKAGQSSNYQVTVATSCTPGKPNLTLSHNGASWGSYANYNARKLSVGWEISNSGAVTAYNVQITGNSNSNNVGRLTALPISLGNLAPGAMAPLTIESNVPASVGSFRSWVTGTAGDCAANSYSYP